MDGARESSPGTSRKRCDACVCTSGNSTTCTRTLLSNLNPCLPRRTHTRIAPFPRGPRTAFSGTVHSRTASFHFHCLGSLVLGRPTRPLSGLAPVLLITLCSAAMLFYSAISRCLISFTRTQPRTELWHL